MKRILRDPVHGNIELDDLDLAIIDSEPFQRLRGIKQLGLVHLVFPGATHTRFEHSIGVKHLAEEIFRVVNSKESIFSEEDLIYLKAAALLHDIAHPPFSHLLEEVVKEYDIDHEKLARKIIEDSELKAILSDYGISIKNVCDIVEGLSPPLSQIIKSDLDADRLDYLQRDAYYCGVAYGVIDSRILREFVVHEGNLAVSEKGLYPAVTVLFARHTMFTVVYGHKTSRAAGCMVVKAVRRALDECIISFSDLFKLTDDELLFILRNSNEKYCAEIANRIRRRRLFKMAYQLKGDSLHIDSILDFIFIKENVSEKMELEEEIANKAGVDSKYVALDIPENPVLEEANVKILTDKGLKDIKELSPIAKTLTDAYTFSWSVAVFTSEEYRSLVRDAAKETLEKFLRR
ncbi:MAG TPA: HD domain-containing protein [Thermoprotei archaeon]|nr:HD domain-containing protein [Thermoprotei archaeon]